MQKNSQDFSMQEALRLAKSPAGQQLLALLRKTGGNNFQQAADHASAGDYEKARELLQQALKNPEAAALLKQLGG